MTIPANTSAATLVGILPPGMAPALPRVRALPGVERGAELAGKVVRRLGRAYYDWRAASLSERHWGWVGVGVVVAVHNRSGQRVENFLRSLRHQTKRPDSVDITVVDYGSDAEHAEDIRERCWDWRARYVRVPDGTTQRRRSRALNVGLRQVPQWCKYLLCTDIDMIFAPNFLEWVVRTQIAYPKALTLCRFVDLPEQAVADGSDVVGSFQSIRTQGDYYRDSAIGPCLGATREWFHEVRGFDERLFGEDHDDTDIKQRALRDGHTVVWVQKHTDLLHQWHWRRFENPRTDEERAEHQRYKRHWETNRQIVLQNKSVVRNLGTDWGVLPVGGEVVEPPERRR